MRCAICQHDGSNGGVLCAACGEQLEGVVPISPEQVAVEGPISTSGAALIDEWGRPHHVGHHLAIGRISQGTGLSILHGSISRKHAVISQARDGWTLCDLASMNGSWVGDRRVDDVLPLSDRCKVRFGPSSFFFVADASRLPVSAGQRAATKTLRLFPRGPTADLDSETGGGLHTTTFAFQQPTGGNCGVVEIDGTAVHLTLAQFELLSILAERMASDQETPLESRGYIDVLSLLDRLSLDSTEPREDSVRQLVRRVRRALRTVNVPGLIESRQGLGYRLGVMPVLRRR